jgi:phosphate transport system substrate-binding protein
MIMKKLLMAAIAAALTVGAARAEKLVVKGSDTLGAKLVPQLAEAFKAKHPGVSFEIAAEGSTTGIVAIIDSTADIGMASRRAKSTEVASGAVKGVKLSPTVVAYDGIAIVVNAGNPVKNLSKRQLEQIFTGDVTDWSAVGGKPGKISVYTRNTASGTYSEFKEMAMNKRDYAGSSQKLAGNEQIVAEVAKNPNGIGYVGMAYVNVSGIRVLTVDGGSPTKESVQAHQYPLARNTYFYTNGAPSGLAKQFIDFIMSPAGEKIIDQVGFVSVK